MHLIILYIINNLISELKIFVRVKFDKKRLGSNMEFKLKN